MLRAEISLLLAAASSLYAATGLPLPLGGEQVSAPAPEVQRDAMQIDRAADGLFYVHARVNGQKVRFLVDTGANVTVLRGEDAKRLGLSAIKDNSTRLQGAAGTTALRWAQMEQIEIAGRRFAQVEAAVIDHGAPVSLLGQDMLSRMGGMTLSGDRMLIR